MTDDVDLAGFDLSAELASQKERLQKQKGKSKYSLATPVTKKPSLWSRSNKGVSKRAASDAQRATDDDVGRTNYKASLERKAKMYERMKRQGKNNADSLVDFELKNLQSSSSDSDEGEDDNDDDDFLEVTDEFGRARKVHISEVRVNDPMSRESKVEVDESQVIHGEYIPRFRVADERKQAFEEAKRDPIIHYDADKDYRSLGRSYYKFSKDERERQEQMESLKEIHNETERFQQQHTSKTNKRDYLMANKELKSDTKRKKMATSPSHEKKRVSQTLSSSSLKQPSDNADDFLKSIWKDINKNK